VHIGVIIIHASLRFKPNQPQSRKIFQLMFYDKRQIGENLYTEMIWACIIHSS